MLYITYPELTEPNVHKDDTRTTNIIANPLLSVCYLIYFIDSHLMGVNPMHRFQAFSANIYCLGNKYQYQYQYEGQVIEVEFVLCKIKIESQS